jgi:hypothetical protein
MRTDRGLDVSHSSASNNSEPRLMSLKTTDRSGTCHKRATHDHEVQFC